MDFTDNIEVIEVIDEYPPEIAERIHSLRKTIIDTAQEMKADKLDETLKWGEPSYVAKRGSTIRLGWKSAKPDQYAMFFTCTTSLVETFRMLHGNKFEYEGNRALWFHVDDDLPLEEVKHCISLALNYHRLKHLPLLGA